MTTELFENRVRLIVWKELAQEISNLERLASLKKEYNKMTWIDAVVEANSENEAPAKFFYWSAMASISAVVRKNVFLDRFYYKLYPNIYVFLIAKSGMKKGVPVTLARNLVTKAGTSRIISGRNSMQRIVQDLGKAFSLENGGVIKDAQGFLVSGELAAFLVKDPDALTILTDLHDTHAYEDVWTNSLKGTGVDKLRSPCLTLLGATNEDHFAEAVPQNAIGGGFIARTFIVFSLEKGKLNSLTEAPTKIVDTSYLSEYLKEVAKMKGEFQWTAASKKTYDKWYYSFMASDANDPTGTMNRIGDQILKVAMIISMAQEPDLILKESHVLEAIDVSTACLAGMQQVTMGAGKSNLAFQTKIVMRELLQQKEHKISRQKLLQKYWGEFDGFDLDRIIETLIGAGAVKLGPDPKQPLYILKDEALNIYTKALQGIQ